MLETLILGFQLAIKAAPKVIELVTQAKDYIATLFRNGLISKEEQDRAHAHCDQYQADALAGNVPVSWTVEADPVAETAAAPSPAPPAANESTAAEPTRSTGARLAG